MDPCFPAGVLFEASLARAGLPGEIGRCRRSWRPRRRGRTSRRRRRRQRTVAATLMPRNRPTSRRQRRPRRRRAPRRRRRRRRRRERARSLRRRATPSRRRMPSRRRTPSRPRRRGEEETTPSRPPRLEEFCNRRHRRHLHIDARVAQRARRRVLCHNRGACGAMRRVRARGGGSGGSSFVLCVVRAHALRVGWQGRELSALTSPNLRDVRIHFLRV